MYFRIVSGSSSVSDCGLGKKRQVENESKLYIRLLLSDSYADFIPIIIQPFVRQICLYIWRKVVKYNAVL